MVLLLLPTLALASPPLVARSWVPLASVFELDASRPTPVTVLGRRYVCWSTDDQWHVADDVCPHASSLPQHWS